MEITAQTELRGLYDEPTERAVRKQMPRLDRHARAIIAASPFCVVGSAAADGRADVSPKGDAPGFVAVLDDNTLLVPDRPGNNRLDTMQNVLENPHVGLLFLVPGLKETLRVNGRARITRDPALLLPLSVNDRAPKSGLLVEIDEVFLHCPKALIRSDLWNAEKHVPPGTFPSMGRMLADQIEGVDAGEAERQHERSIRERLY